MKLRIMLFDTTDQSGSLFRRCIMKLLMKLRILLRITLHIMLLLRISLVAVLITLALAPPVCAADIDSFRGMRWGSTLADLQQTKKLLLTKEGGKKSASLYAMEGEDLRYGKAVLDGIHCSFAQDRLVGVILLFGGAKNFAAVKAEAFARFGQTQEIDQKTEVLYNWSGKITNSILSYNKGSQSGFLFIKVKKMPPPAQRPSHKKPVASPAPSAAPHRAPLLEASPFEPASTKPTISPVDMETALDRAPPPAPPAPSAQEVNGISAEIQALIHKDQVLTQVCWESNGPAADAACVQMQETLKQLNALGLCIKADAAGQTGTEVVWYRCNRPDAATSPPEAAPTRLQQENTQINTQIQPLQTETAAATAPSPDAIKSQRCHQLGELFAAAAQMRDMGVEPQRVEEELLGLVSSQAQEMTIERIRETVELVYFDQEYNHSSGQPLVAQVSNRCLDGNGPFAHPFP